MYGDPVMGLWVVLYFVVGFLVGGFFLALGGMIGLQFYAWIAWGREDKKVQAAAQEVINELP